jgi:hypothetical protein
MNKETFIQNFKLVLVHLQNHTSELCFNEFSTNYKFIIEPSERTISDHLINTENGYLKTWNKLTNKQISFEQVVELFYRNGKTPKWADCTIYYSSQDITVVHIFFSREFTTEDEVYYLDWGTGPFKAMVALPPDNLKITKGDKFDVNWKKRLDDNRRNNIFKRVKHFLIASRS